MIKILPLIFILSACTCRSSCPPWPIAGKTVAEELKEIPEDGFEDFWEWMARLNKLKEQLK